MTAAGAKRPAPEDVERLAARLRARLESESAPPDLVAYFREPTSSGSPSFTGRWFERLGGGGDRPPNHNHITATDLVAIEMLSVQVPAEVSAQILHGPVGRSVSNYLGEVPIDVQLGDAGAAAVLDETSAISAAWALLDGQPGVGWVTAGKILARKRPHLIPVYDAVVKCALGAPQRLWVTMQEVWVHDPEVPARITQLRDLGHVPGGVSDLRVLDVVIWMGHRGDHRRTNCAATALD